LAPDFELVGGHAALDFVNTLDERLSGAPEERLRGYDDLLAFAREVHLIERSELRALASAGTAAERKSTLARAVALREATHRLLVALPHPREAATSELALIEREIGAAREARRLERSGTAIRWQWKEARSAQRPLHEVALALAELFLSSCLSQVRKCAAADCGVWFMDGSRAGRRRWCDMKTCGNREKVRRFRA